VSEYNHLVTRSASTVVADRRRVTGGSMLGPRSRQKVEARNYSEDAGSVVGILEPLEQFTKATNYFWCGTHVTNLTGSQFFGCFLKRSKQVREDRLEKYTGTGLGYPRNPLCACTTAEIGSRSWQLPNPDETRSLPKPIPLPKVLANLFLQVARRNLRL
jgi:hypothetical protein